MEKKLQNKTLFFIPLLYFSIKNVFIKVFTLQQSFLFFKKVWRKFGVKTVLHMYQRYIVILQLGIDIAMKVKLYISTLMVTVSQNSRF